MDCSSLLQHIQEINNSNITDNTTNEIWLELDETTIFDVEYSTTFWFGLLITIIISILSSYILSYHYYPYFDKQQKLIKLKVLNIEPHQQDKITPYLEDNTEYNKDVEGVIYDYAGIGNVSMNTILDSTIELRSPFKDLLCFLLISSLFIASYFQFYWVIAHWTDSYRSYIETECYYYYYDNDADPDYFDFEININKLCKDENKDIDDYIFDIENFYSSYHDTYTEDIDNLDSNERPGSMDYDEVYTGSCYIHKDNFTVRAGTGKSGGCDCDSCARCGKCWQPGHWDFCCNACCCQNACGYCVCITTGLASIIGCLWLIWAKVDYDTKNKYKIEQRAMTATNGKGKDREYLLTIQESSGEINL